MCNLEKALISASIINVIFNEYNKGELNRSSELIRKRIAKFMRKRSKINRKLFLDVVKNTNKAWAKTVNNFSNKNLKIEAKTTIASIYNYSSDELEKFSNIKHKDIELLTICTTDDLEAEKNSDIFVDYIMRELGFEKKKSIISGRYERIKHD